MQIAIYDKYDAGIDYSNHFNFEFDEFYLVDSNLKKVLVKDLDKQLISDVIEEYDLVITVGADSTKHVAGLTRISEKQGKVFDNKFIPLTSPRAAKIHPAALPAFAKAVRDINNYVNGTTDTKVELDLTLLDSEDLAMKYLNNVAGCGVIAVDTETSGLSFYNDYVLGISISHKEHQGVYIPIEFMTDTVIAKLRSIFESGIKIVFHNAKFDMHHIKASFGILPPKVWEDTMMLHYMLDETQGSHGLKAIALKYTDIGDYEADLDEWKSTYCRSHGLKKEDFSYEYIPIDIIFPYAATDTAVTIAAYYLFFPKVSSNKGLNRVYTRLLKPGLGAMFQLEENGIPFDKDRLESGKEFLTRRIAEKTKELATYPEVKKFEDFQGVALNTNSVQQLRGLLFGTLGLNPSGIMTDTGEHSTNAESLEKIAEQHPIAKTILEIRKLTKILNTYAVKLLKNIDSDGRLRTNFNLTTTTSGRLSSSGAFNAQQIPREGIGKYIVKGALKARPGYKIVSQDLATAEVYVAAVLSGDVALQGIFKTGGDLHSQMAKAIFNLTCPVEDIKELHAELRSAIKAITFGINGAL